MTETGWGEFAIQIVIHFIDINEKPITLTHMLQLYFKDDNPLKLTDVISENYEELEFHNPSQDLSDALLSHPWEDLEKPRPNPRFNPEEQDKEHKSLQEALEKILAEYEITKQRIPQLEQVWSLIILAITRSV